MSIEDAVKQIMASRPTFKTGDRVLIRLGGECRVDWGASYADGHPEVFNGMQGTVIEDALPPVELEWGKTHPIPVRFDDLVYAPLYANGDDNWWHGNYFAPTELELVSEPLAAADARRGEDEHVE